MVIPGPAVIEEPATTIVLDRAARATVAATHYMIDVGVIDVGRTS
jgi:hypothetical protein